MIITIVNHKQVSVPVEEFLKLLKMIKNATNISGWQRFWCDGKELNLKKLSDSLKFE